MKRLLHNNLFGSFAVLTGGRLAGAVATFLASLIIARQFGAETLGAFSVLLAVTGILSVLASGGFPAIGGIFSARYAASGRPRALKSLFEAGRKHILIGACISMGAALAWFAISRPYPGDLVFMAGFTALAVLGMAASNFFGAVLAGLERQQAGLLPDTLIKPLVFLLFVGSAALAGLKADPVLLLACFAAGALTAAAFTYLQLGSEPSLARTVTAEARPGGWLRTAYPWIITTLVWDFFIELHIILAGWIAAPAEVAVLHVAFRFRMLAGFGMRALYALFLPAIVTADTRGDDAAARAKLMKVNLLALVYSAAVMGFFAIAGSLLMGLFGSAFAAGWPLLVILSSTMMIRAVFGPAPALLAMKGHQMPSAIVMMGCLLVSLVSTLALYPQIGLMGIAISYTGANFLGSAILWQVTKRLTGIDGSLFTLIRSKHFSSALGAAKSA